MKKYTERMEFKPFCVLIAIILLCGLISGGDFFKITIVDGHFYGRLIDILRNGSRYAILAAGMTMALGTGGTDISVGSVMAISGAIACSIVDSRILPGLNGSVAAAVILALLAGAVCGAWNGFMIAKLKVQPMVATMILLTAGRGIAQLIADGKIVTITSEEYYNISGGYLLGFPAPMFIAIGVIIIFLLLTKGTAFGMQVESIGVNQNSSRLAGIKVERNLWLIYILCDADGALAERWDLGSDTNAPGLLTRYRTAAFSAFSYAGTNLADNAWALGWDCPTGMPSAISVKWDRRLHSPAPSTPLGASAPQTPSARRLYLRRTSP